jgi:DNA-binding MarR family transcriptional regulator
MVALINDLVDKHMVERVVDPGDRRAFALTVTGTGATTLADAVARIEEHERHMLVDLSAEERTLLLDLLGRIERRSPATDADDQGEG